MLYATFMLGGLILGVALGREAHGLWGLLFGLVLAHMIRLGRRVGQLEQTIEERPSVQQDRASPPAAVEPPTEVAPASGSGTPVPRPQPDQTDPLRWAREAQPARESVAAGPSPTAPADPVASEIPAADDQPLTPSLARRGMTALIGFFTTGNPLVRIGALVLFVGVAFLLSYLAERVSVSIEMRLLGIAAGGVAMVLTGLLLRGRRPGFALPFQGAGIGVIYLTTYAALRLYPVLPAVVALIVMLIVVAITIGLALWQNSSALVTLGVVGGFLAPVLTATGQGSHVELFSFYLVLNVGIAVIAWFRAWRWLNWLGFVFTFGIASLWGAQYYSPEYFATTEPFLLAHVALYLTVAVLFALRQPPELKGLVDGTLVFGTPLVGFTLQSLLLEGRGTALAISAAVFGGIYLLLRQLLLGRDPRHFRLLGQCFLALGAGFLTLAVPLAFDARVTSAVWTLEGAAVAWVGIHQGAWIRRWAGYLLMAVGSLAFLVESDLGGPSAWIFLNADYIGIAIVTFGFLFVADQIRRHQPERDLPGLAAVMWVYGSAWFWAGGLVELERRLSGGELLLATVAYFGVGIIAVSEYARRANFAAARSVAIVASGLLALMTLIWRAPEAGTLLLNTNTLAAAGVVAVLTRCGMRLWRDPQRGAWANLLAILGLGIWLVSGLLEIDARFGGSEGLPVGLIFVTLTLLGGSLASVPLRWRQWQHCTGLLCLVPGFYLLLMIDRPAQPLSGLGWLAWPLAFAVIAGLLRWRENSTPRALAPYHALAFWSLIGVLTHATLLWLETRVGRDSAWWLASLAAVPWMLAAAVQLPALRRRWPVAAHPHSYGGIWLLPVIFWTAAWLVVSNVMPPGDFQPAPYLPVLNVQDLVCLGLLWLWIHWWSRVSAAAPTVLNRSVPALIGALAFLFLNAALLRALAHYLPIDWDLGLMLKSFTVQASVTLLWVSLALAVMVVGSRTARRWLWVVGSTLMAVVVLKLFLVDMAASGTLARIAAFFGVAVSLFVAGYLAPRPPARNKTPAADR